MIVKLNIPITPTPHQSVRMTRQGRAYQPKKIVDYKNDVQGLVREQLPASFCLIKADTPIHITRLHYCFKYPSTFPKYKKDSMEVNYKVTKPDLHDNLNKALFDALEGVVWERDQNVVSIDDMKKYYAPTDHILIEIECSSY
jgi:Holliday junction resolvase RusA-like endonuclease